MTARICAVPHCGRSVASAYSPHCLRHKSTVRRHGAPDQRGLTQAEINPYLGQVAARIVKNPESEAWPLLEATWASLVEDAEIVAARRIGNRYERNAANEIISIAQSSLPLNLISVVLAVVMLWYEHPQRFASDNALRVQLARRARALSQAHVGRRYDYRTGQLVRVYREIAPKTAALLGHKLMVAFGGVGLKLAALNERDRVAAHNTKQRLNTAISQLN